MRIYTRGGDSGTTSLPGGKRVNKDTPIIDFCGTLDELSSLLGMTLAFSKNQEITTLLLELQQQLFSLGTDVTHPEAPTQITATHVNQLESNIDIFSGRLPELRTFVLPGGSPDAAILHLARTVARRAERCLVSCVVQHYISPTALAYCNRLSDLLFVLARYANFNAQVPETTWQP